MENKPLAAGTARITSSGDTAKKPVEKEKSSWDKVRDFFERNILEKDAESGDFKVNKKMYGVAAGEAAIGAAVGAKVGAEHQTRDIVTHETVVRDVMKNVQVGEKTVTGGYHYHYGMHMNMDGEMEFGYHYGYDPLWTHQEPIYEKVPTGEKVSEVVTHHTEKFPYTTIQGIIAGTLIGGVVGVATLTIAKIMAEMKNS
jgi:hypothetical protein